MLQLPTFSEEKRVLLPAHTISPCSPFLIYLLALLGHFFSNEVETNLLLTKTIVILACCALMIGVVNVFLR